MESGLPNKITHKEKPDASVPRFSFDEIEDIFLYFSTSILEKETEEDILWDLAKNCIAQLGFEDCVIYLLDEAGEFLIQKAAYGPKNPRDYDIYNPIQIPVGHGICGSVVITGRAEIVHDTSQDPRYIVDDQVRYSELTIPIRLDGKVIGVIDCEHEQKGYFNEQHKRILEAMASICSIKLSKLKAEQAIQKEQQKLKDAQNQMEDLKIAVFKSQMNPHFLFNAMNAVQYFITSDDKKSALTYMSVLGKLLRYRLAHFQEETAFLHKEIEAVSWFLTLQKMRFGAKFNYQLDTGQSATFNQVTIPALVLPLILESAVEAALRDQPVGYVHLGIEVKNDLVTLDLKHNLTERSSSGRSAENPQLWKDQIDLINDLQIYKINTRVRYKAISEEMTEVLITVDIPILT